MTNPACTDDRARLENIAWLLQQSRPDVAELAARLGICTVTVERTLTRAGRLDLLDQARGNRKQLNRSWPQETR